jgi:hypothetical protein
MRLAGHGGRGMVDLVDEIDRLSREVERLLAPTRSNCSPRSA